jgi:hypothetical protein
MLIYLICDQVVSLARGIDLNLGSKKKFVNLEAISCKKVRTGHLLFG